MNDTQVTLAGTVATEPVYKELADRTPLCSFRLAVNARRFDRAAGGYVDGATSWYSVTCWRHLAVNAHASLEKGQRVLVTGRLQVEEWESEDGRRSAAKVEALGVGPDLLFGTTTFRRANRPLPATPPALGQGLDPGPEPVQDPALERGLDTGRDLDGRHDADPTEPEVVTEVTLREVPA